VFISCDKVRKNAEDYKTSFPNELLRVTIHGILHLIGYKDYTAEERQQMRKKEDYYLEYFKINFS
jgi:rRNA maturation RNase YbeY